MYGRPLFSLSVRELRAAAREEHWPKWSTLCLLRLLGLPSLNAICVPPQSDGSALAGAVDALVTSTRTTRLMLRSDGGLERRAYHRGGHSLRLAEIPDRAARLLAMGRAVILLEPTNRFTNRLTALLRLERGPYGAGTFTVEALGRGFDVADLTRGGLTPQVSITVEGVDWRRFRRPWWSDFTVIRDVAADVEEARRYQRLEQVGMHLQALAELSPRPDPDLSTAAAGWLESMGYVDLFSGADPTDEVVRRTHGWYEDAFAVTMAYPHKGWDCLALSYSELSDRRPVYWDLIDGARKYAIR